MSPVSLPVPVLESELPPVPSPESLVLPLLPLLLPLLPVSFVELFVELLPVDPLNVVIPVEALPESSMFGLGFPLHAVRRPTPSIVKIARFMFPSPTPSRSLSEFYTNRSGSDASSPQHCVPSALGSLFGDFPYTGPRVGEFHAQDLTRHLLP